MIDQAQVIQDKLASAINAEQWDQANDFSNILESFVLNASGNIDLDNILYPVDPMQDLFGPLDEYLNSEGIAFPFLLFTMNIEVKKSLNVGNNPWNFINMTTENALNADEQQSVLPLLPNLISNYRVLIYTGNMVCHGFYHLIIKDMNCNLLGVEAYIDKFNWPYKVSIYVSFSHIRNNSTLLLEDFGL